MRHSFLGVRSRIIGSVLVVAAFVTVPSARASANDGHRDEGMYQVTNLVSDVPGLAAITDPNLANAWGLAAGPATPIWVANNHTDTSTLYRGAVGGAPISKVPLVVNIAGGAPTGVVFNDGTGFVVSDTSGASGGARFIFSSEGGDITGWNPAVPPPPPSTQSQPAAHVNGAVYKGLALATSSHGPRLLAANFAAGTIDVFDTTFTLLHDGKFTDPSLPSNYAPFNVTVLNGKVFVSYAQQDPNGPDDVKGPGHGYIDVYDPDGNLLRRVVSGGALNSPWGMAIAPAGFGRFSGKLLVGNFGDGHINVYSLKSGKHRGMLATDDESPVTIDGLWALQFGNSVIGGPTSLLFSAGPNDEQHGLFGMINVAESDDD